jgi:hypothetical protein
MASEFNLLYVRYSNNHTHFTYEWPVTIADQAQITVAAANKTQVRETSTIGEDIELDVEVFYR